MDSHLQISKISQFVSSCDFLNPSKSYHLPFLISVPNTRTKRGESWNVIKPLYATMNGDQSAVHEETILSQLRKNAVLSVDGGSSCYDKSPRKRRVFFLDVNPLCYRGSTPSLDSFAHWISLFFSQVSLNDPVVAVSPLLCVWRERIAFSSVIYLLMLSSVGSVPRWAYFM